MMQFVPGRLYQNKREKLVTSSYSNTRTTDLLPKLCRFEKGMHASAWVTDMVDTERFWIKNTLSTWSTPRDELSTVINITAIHQRIMLFLKEIKFTNSNNIILHQFLYKEKHLHFYMAPTVAKNFFIEVQ